MKDTLLQASPEKIKKQLEDADRAMKELLETEENEPAASAAGSQKKKQAKAGKSEKKKKKTDNVAAVAVVAGLKDRVEVAAAESTHEHHKWIKQSSQSGNDMRHHIEVHASHREQVWESPSASLIEQDPEVIPDVDIAAQVGKDLFLDEKIPRHESGQGYVRVLEKSIMWRETETAKVFTYQGLTTCTELDKSWTIMSSTYNHLRQGRDKGIDELKAFIRAEVELQERLEATGYRPPTWRLLRVLQSLLSAVQLRGESAVTAPPSSPAQGEAQRNSGGKDRDQQSSCGRVWTKKDGRSVRRRCARAKTGWCGVGRDKALGVLESKWNPIRQKLVRRLLEEQDKVLRSYFAQQGGTRGQRGEGNHGQGRDHVKWDMYV